MAGAKEKNKKGSLVGAPRGYPSLFLRMDDPVQGPNFSLGLSGKTPQGQIPSRPLRGGAAVGLQ